MNAQMRRIDLFCKLLGPLFVALIDGISTEVAICVNLVMNVLSIPLEYFAIARVYYSMRVLQQPRTAQVPGQPGFDAPQESNTQWKHYKMWLQPLLTKYASDFSLYFHHRAFFPSIAGALLYMTVLSFAGQMVTYLLTVGYSSTQVGVARIFSVAFELLATWIAPWMMGRVGPIRAGLWLSSWQLSALIAGVGIFWTLPSTPSISASGLVVGTIISRVGLRGFDLCVQIIVQEVSDRLCYLLKIAEEQAKPGFRRSKPRFVALSPLSRPPGKMLSSFFPSLQLSYSIILNYSNGLHSCLS